MSTPSTLATRARDVATEMAAQAGATILHTFPPAVMVLSDAAAEAARIEVIRQLVADSLQEVREGELPVDIRVNNALQGLRDDGDAMEAVTASLAIIFDARRQAEIQAAKLTSQAKASEVATALDLAAIELNLVADDVKALPTLGQSSRQLKVTGAAERNQFAC